VNPRPSKAELEALLARISFPKRVVQVWFQNMRARDRRKARIAAASGGLYHRAGESAVTAAAATALVRPGLSLCSYTTQDEPLDLSRPDARPPPGCSISQPPSTPHDHEEEEQALNLSTRRLRRSTDDDDDDDEDDEEDDESKHQFAASVYSVTPTAITGFIELFSFIDGKQYLFVSRLIRKCFGREFLDIFEDIFSLLTCFRKNVKTLEKKSEKCIIQKLFSIFKKCYRQKIGCVIFYCCC